MSAILVAVCVFNGSYLVVFITRFTEELFASFIAVIFIIGAFQKIYAIGVKFPISPSRDAVLPDGYSQFFRSYVFGPSGF